MIELSVIRDLVAIFGVIAGFSYYVLTVRNAQRAQELTLKAQEQATKTRLGQIVMQLERWRTSKEAWRDHIEWSKLEWDDYSDFEDKYGSDVNPENYMLRGVRIARYQDLGLLVKHGVIDTDIAYDMSGMMAIQDWNRYGEIIKTQRELYDQPMVGIHWEYLYDEMVKIAKQRGHDTTVKYHISYTDEMRKKMT